MEKTNNMPWDCPDILGKGGQTPRPGNAELCQWPLKLRLISPTAPFFHKSDLLIAADCSAFTYKGFHKWIHKDRPLVICCPMLDGESFTEKLDLIININDIETITAVRMDANCCQRFTSAVMSAIKKSGKDIPLKLTTVFTEGELAD